MIDWDSEVLGPTMAEFGEGLASDPTTWPTYHPRSGAPFQLADAVFDGEYADVVLDQATGAEATVRKPVLGVRMSLFPANEPHQDSKVYVPSVATMFLVKDVRPDGHGYAKLMLMLSS